MSVTPLPYVVPPFRSSVFEHVYSETGSKHVLLHVT